MTSPRAGRELWAFVGADTGASGVFRGSRASSATATAGTAQIPKAARQEPSARGSTNGSVSPAPESSPQHHPVQVHGAAEGDPSRYPGLHGARERGLEQRDPEAHGDRGREQGRGRVGLTARGGHDRARQQPRGNGAPHAEPIDRPRSRDRAQCQHGKRHHGEGADTGAAQPELRGDRLRERRSRQHRYPQEQPDRPQQREQSEVGAIQEGALPLRPPFRAGSRRRRGSSWRRPLSP